MILHCDDGIRHVEAVLEEPTNQRLFLRHLGHVIGVKIARRLCLRLGVTIAAHGLFLRHPV